MPDAHSTNGTCIVIYGASGDLTRRKLVPALFRLLSQNLLPPFAIIGASRSELNDDQFRESLRSALAGHATPDRADLVDAFLSRCFYQPTGYDSAEDTRKLAARIQEVEGALGLPGHRLFYLSTPPSVFATIVTHLGSAGLVQEREGRHARVIIEKPFGTDLSSAQALNRQIRGVLAEKQIYRIDHYLGKETVQNLLVFRFANGIFEPLWNNRYVSYVEITHAETLGMEGRGSYFDKAGIMRDMVQNHLFQILSLAAMEPPASFAADSVRNEKLKVLEALRPIEASDLQRVVRGQYVAGNNRVGYREEKDVPVDSRTETFVALELLIDNWRWAGVPFYLRSGKALGKKVTEIAVHFKDAPHRLFHGDSVSKQGGNVLAVRIQPDEGIELGFGSKVPGPSIEIAPVKMQFRYASAFAQQAAEAYERLLLDAINGDGTLFIRGDEAEASWRFISPIHEAWVSSPDAPEPYTVGSWGPEGAFRLLSKSGRHWRMP